MILKSSNRVFVAPNTQRKIIVDLGHDLGHDLGQFDHDLVMGIQDFWHLAKDFLSTS